MEHPYSVTFALTQVAPFRYRLIAPYPIPDTPAHTFDPDNRPVIPAFPVAFEWDGATIPRALWSVIGASPGRFLRASCVHDYLYGTGLVPREVADAIFYSMIRQDGARRLQARLMWRAVRTFGKSHYAKKKKREAKE